MLLTILNSSLKYLSTQQNPFYHYGIHFHSVMKGDNVLKDSNDGIVIFFTGTLYNTEILCKWLNIDTRTNLEIILLLYKRYGFDYTLNALDGVFSFILLDQRIENEVSKVYIVRDAIGIIPIYTNRRP